MIAARLVHTLDKSSYLNMDRGATQSNKYAVSLRSCLCLLGWPEQQAVGWLRRSLQVINISIPPSATTATRKQFLWMWREAIYFTSLSALLNGIQQRGGGGTGGRLEREWRLTQQAGRQLKDKIPQLHTETCSLCVNSSQIDLRIRFPGRDASFWIDLDNICLCMGSRQ